jgi:hypothetical protein
MIVAPLANSARRTVGKLVEVCIHFWRREGLVCDRLGAVT